MTIDRPIENRSYASSPLITIRYDGNEVFVDGDRSGLIGVRYSDGTGYYLSWNWDGTELIVESHPYGSYPAFYTFGADHFSLAARMEALFPILAPKGPELDRTSIAVFFVTGIFDHETTAVKDVWGMPEGGRLSWKKGTLVKSERPPADAVASLPKQALIEEYCRLFSRAVEKAEFRSATIPLSGGKDSRHILAELIRQGRRPDKCVTLDFFPPRGTNDVEIARTLAKRLGVPHIAPNRTRGLIDSDRIKNVLNNFSTLEGAWKSPLFEYSNSNDTDVIDGLGGGVLAGGIYLSWELHESFSNGDLPKVAQKFRRREFANLVRFMPDLLGDVREKDVEDRYHWALADCQNEHNPIIAYVLWNRNRREMAANSTGIYDFGRIHSPFFNLEVFHFLRSIAIDIMIEKTFREDTISHCYPEIADIPYSGPNRVQCTPSFRARNAWELLRQHPHGSLANLQRSAELMARLLPALLSPRDWRWTALPLHEIIWANQIVDFVHGRREPD